MRVGERREPPSAIEKMPEYVENPYKSPTDTKEVPAWPHWWPISGVSFGTCFGAFFMHVLLTFWAFRAEVVQVSHLRILIATGGVIGGILGLVWSWRTVRPRIRLIEWILLFAAIILWLIFMPA